VRQLAEHYAGDPRVMFTVIDNSLGRGKSKLSDLDSVPDISKNVPELKEKLSEALEQAHRIRSISDSVYRGFRENT